MKASELNGTHLNRQVTVAENGNTARGWLAQVNHRGDILNERLLGSGLFQQELGRTWVELEFLGNLAMNVSPNAEVTIHAVD